MRKARTLKEFANFLKIKSDAKRPQHGKKGVAARTRRSGAVTYEARITHIPIGVRLLLTPDLIHDVYISDCIARLQQR